MRSAPTITISILFCAIRVAEARDLPRVPDARPIVVGLPDRVSGPQPCRPVEVVPEQAMKIEDFVYYHNVGITWGDGRYYTLNGGNVAQADGGDILFIAGDGHTKLDHEIERYDETTGELVARL